MADADFGHAVDVSHDAMVVGAPGEGAAYVFERAGDGSWSQAAKLAVSGVGSWAHFGQAVAIDGGTAVVGAPFASQAYVFERTVDGWGLAHQVGSPASDGFTGFGWSVALEGDLLAVGAPHATVGDHDRAGYVHVFRLGGGTWTLESELTPDLGEKALLGWRVAASGSSLVASAVGQDAVAAFDLEATGWQHTTTISSDAPFDGFGRSVDLEGDTMAIGAPFTTNPAGIRSGAVHLYERSGGDWTEVARVGPEDLGPLEGEAGFGWDVVIAENTPVVVVGAPGDDQSPGVSSPAGEQADPVCVSAGISPTCHPPGAVYILQRGATGWQQADKVVGADAPPAHLTQLGSADGLGRAVAVDSEATTVAAGAPRDDWVPGDDAGATYLFGQLDLEAAT